MFERLLPLIDDKKFQKISNARILLAGVGGVGGYVLEALVRSGFLNITIVDGDIINLSNLNRQIIADRTNIGKLKVEEAKERVFKINESVKLKVIGEFLTEDNFNNYINEDYDYIIDAVDDIKIKVLLIKYAKNNGNKIITCLGTGRKLDPTKLEITKLNKTFNDPLAKKLRYELKKQELDLNIPVLFSKEEAIKVDNSMIASAIFVPATAGVYLANYVFRDIINDNGD